MKLQSSAISVSSFFATKSLVSRVIIGSTFALMGLQIALAETVLYGGLGGHSMASNVMSILALTSVLALAPGILVMGTSFTRLVVVLSMLRTALTRGCPRSCAGRSPGTTTTRGW